MVNIRIDATKANQNIYEHIFTDLPGDNVLRNISEEKVKILSSEKIILLGITNLFETLKTPSCRPFGSAAFLALTDSEW